MGHALCDILPRFTIEQPRVERPRRGESLSSERASENADRTADGELDSLHDRCHVLDPATCDVSLSYGSREGEIVILTPVQTAILSSSMAGPCRGKGQARFLPHSQHVRAADSNSSEDIPSSIKSRTTPLWVASLAGENARKML